MTVEDYIYPESYFKKMTFFSKISVSEIFFFVQLCFFSAKHNILHTKLLLLLSSVCLRLSQPVWPMLHQPSWEG